MRHWTKLLCMVLCAVLTLSLAACSPAAPAVETPAAVETEAPAPAPEAPAQAQDETMEAEVVVIGGGLAGLSASITAAQAGAKVVLLEKLEAVGGSTNYSAGALATAARDTDPAGAYTADMLYDHWVEVSEGNIDKDLARKIADMSADSVAWIEEQGLPLTRVDSTYIGKELVLVTTHTDERNRIVSTVGGPILVQGLLAQAEALGVTVLTSTPATELLADDAGAIIGVVATKADGASLTLNTQNVILATGGFTANTELMTKVCPDIGDVTVLGGPGNTGDAIAMATALGAAETYGDEVGNGCYLTSDGNFSIYQIGMDVNDAGQRFMNEANFYGKAYVAMREQIRQGYTNFQIIFDSASPYVEDCEAGVAAGNVVKADTLEELASLIGVDAAGLVETAAAYDALKGREDTAFGKPADLMYGMSVAPFYAVKLSPVALGTFGGLSIDTQARILKADGSYITGLYGAGECAAATFFWNEYPYSGSCLQYSVSTGRIAGANAAAAK